MQCAPLRQPAAQLAIQKRLASHSHGTLTKKKTARRDNDEKTQFLFFSPPPLRLRAARWDRPPRRAFSGHCVKKHVKKHVKALSHRGPPALPRVARRRRRLRDVHTRRRRETRWRNGAAEFRFRRLCRKRTRICSVYYWTRIQYTTGRVYSVLLDAHVVYYWTRM